MKIITLVLSLLVLLGAVELPAQAAKAKGKKKTSKTTKTTLKFENISFKKDVTPIIHTYCMPCHSEERSNPSEMYMDSYDAIMQGGKHGSPIVAGNPDASNMIKKISFKPPFGDPMPLKRKIPFPKDTLEMLKTWIREGAKNN